jgi:hypothetical protein
VRERRAACRIAAWQSEDRELRNELYACLDDEDHHVCDAAADALERWAQWAVTENLLSALDRANARSEKWLLVDLILDTADLGGTDEPLPPWVHRVLRRLSPYHREYFLDKVKKRTKEVERDAEWTDRRLRS